MDQKEHPQNTELQKSARSSLYVRTRAKLQGLYEKYEKYVAIAIFLIGFIWDSLTLTRVDNPVDNVILLFYLILIGTLIVFTLRRQSGAAPPRWLLKIEPYFPWIMQFCFGGLFSSYVVFYFKSSSFSRTQFFFLILVFLLIANEFLQHRLQNEVLLSVLYTFCLLSFLAFFLPVLLAVIDERVFLLACLIGLAASLLVFATGFILHPDGWKRRMIPIASWTISVVMAMNVLYFANLIPPVPLALKDEGIYHSVAKTKAGYEVQYVPPPAWRFWANSDSPFYMSPGDKAHCYTAIFAPGKIHIPVFHIWSRKTPDGWVQTDRMRMDISGGRELGYRGYTLKRSITPGKWRVTIETGRGQTLGEITFRVIPSAAYPSPLKTDLKR